MAQEPPGENKQSGNRQIQLVIRRQESDESSTPYWQEYNCRLDANDRVLDGLLFIRNHVDPTLGFRASCRSGQCGADAMNINGENRLACQTLFADLGSPDRVVIRPLSGYRVKKDLIVELEEVRNSVTDIFRKNQKPPTESLTRKKQQKAREAAICQLCGACDAACPVSWREEDFPGPVQLVKIYRYLQTGGEELKQQLLEQIDTTRGLWACETDFNCLEVCPREINVTDLISRLKRESVEK